MGMSIVLMLGQVPLMTKFWFSAEKAKAGEEAVRKGRADGILPSMER